MKQFQVLKCNQVDFEIVHSCVYCIQKFKFVKKTWENANL